MEAIWFVLVSCTLTAYVVLDGFDLGVGLLSPFVAKSEAEKRQVIRSIGPVWDGNEVWLLAAGGTLLFAFPKVLAAGFSGFYLPLMLVLWLLLFRALSIELRHQLHDPLWTALWDALFFASSALLIIVLGAALGNVLRGVTLDDSGQFFAPLWTSFRPTAPVGALDWFTLAIALEAMVVLAFHASLWLEWRTDEQVAKRAGALGRVLFWGALGGALGVTALALAEQPRLIAGLQARPWVLSCAVPASAIALVPWLRKRGKPGAAFLASSSHIAGLLLAASSSLYPWMLPGTTAGTGWTAQSARSSPYSLEVGLYWWLPALFLVLACQRYVYGRLPDKFRVRDEAPH